MEASIRPLTPNLFLIVLVPPLDGFDDFIGAWLVKREDCVYLVDVGPAVTADKLIGALDALGVTHLDYICLTHIHLDHAGAIGHLSRRFPGASVICHPKGEAHLVDPERLWQGTLKTLGDTGRAYGPILPIDQARLAGPEQIAAAPFEVIDTPGHSPHHFTFVDKDLFFAGEAGGVCLPVPSGNVYLRPATPPRFFMETSLASIDRLMAAKPKTLCYGHLSMREDGMAMLRKHRDQLLLWKRVLMDCMDKTDGDPMGTVDQWIDVLLEKDPLLAGFRELTPLQQQRERSFLSNSVKGFIGYLKDSR